MSKTFDELIAKVNEMEMKKVSVAVAQDSAVLEAVRAAKDRKIADAILVGDKDKILPEKVNALIFDQYRSGYFAVGEKVGQAWNAGKGLMK